MQTNMRVQLCGDQAAGQFAEQLLAIGDGKFPTDVDSMMLSSYLKLLVVLCLTLMN